MNLQEAESKKQTQQRFKKKLKGVVVNTSHCKTEIDILQYVIDKLGIKETTLYGDGNIHWYGFALRD